MRQQDKLSRNIYAKREKVVAEIPEFWPLVIEQAPPEIDEYIQPTDSEVLLNSLKSLSVERFELPEGDPRSIAIKLEFKENEYFENTVLEKKFWWRFAKDGWAGLVSEPVDIKWKAGKDLTGGMLAKVIKVWEEEKAAGGQPDAESETAKALKEQMENTGIGGLSFFSWFGFRGRKVTDEEHQEAYKKYEEKRKARKAGNFSDHEPLEDDNDDDDDDEDEYEMEIFPTGDDLAVCIAEDLWPGAIKYFSMCYPLTLTHTTHPHIHCTHTYTHTPMHTPYPQQHI